MASHQSNRLRIQSPYVKTIQEMKSQEPQSQTKSDSVDVLKNIAQKHGIKKSKQLIESLLKKEVVILAQETALGKDVGELKIFNQYFITNDYDAFKINDGVKDNALLFTLMYLFYKRNWKHQIECLDETKFQNLSYCLQKSYRDNSYHSQVHAADVVQSICLILV